MYARVVLGGEPTLAGLRDFIATFQPDGTMKRIEQVLSCKVLGPDDDGFNESARVC